MKKNTNQKRISINLSDNLISRFDELRKDWGLRSRGAVIEKIIKEFINEIDLSPKNIQQNLEFDTDNNKSLIEFDETSSLVIVDPKVKNDNKNAYITHKYKKVEEKNQNIELPSFIKKRKVTMNNFLNKDNKNYKTNEYQVIHVDNSYLMECGNYILNHWKELYGSPPNDVILKASLDWFSKDIWPYIEGTDNLDFTWSSASYLLKQLCPNWCEEKPRFESVILMIGILEDPFATSNLKNRIPTIVRRFVSKFKNKKNSFEALDSTMTVVGALKLLNLSTKPGSKHTLEKIRKSFKVKALSFHPDKGGHNENMRKINEAYILLKNLYRKQ